MIKFRAREIDCKLLHKSNLLKIDDDEIVLPPKEHAMLRHFLDHEGEIISRDDLLKAVWGEDVFVENDSVDRAVSELRDKLGDSDKRSFIVTVRKKGSQPGGYKLVAKVVENRPGDDFDPEEVLHNVPSRLLIKLKGHGYTFFDSLYEHEARDAARKRIENDQKDQAARTKAALAGRFGVRAVKLEEQSWRCDITFPSGRVQWDRAEDLRGDGYESDVWTEFTLTIDAYDPEQIEWLLQNCMPSTHSTSIVFCMKGRIDIDAVAEALFTRRVAVRKLNNSEVTVESATRDGKKFILALSSQGESTTAEAFGWSASNFKDLRRALTEIRTVFELDKQLASGELPASQS